MGRREPTPNEQRVVLENVSWQKFETLLSEMGGDRTSPATPPRVTRFTYERGRLEMMNPLEDHERCRKLIESLLLVLVDELEWTVESEIAPCLLRQDLQLGTEPDACYYVNPQATRTTTHRPAELTARSVIDLNREPVPDLIQEVALTKSQIDKLPIYAALGVPEVWRYVTQPGAGFFKGDLVVYVLEQDFYAESTLSQVFPFLPAAKILEFIEHSDSMGLMAALRVFRAWVEEQIP
jgi:Uma2 family endonuclease